MSIVIEDKAFTTPSSFLEDLAWQWEVGQVVRQRLPDRADQICAPWIANGIASIGAQAGDPETRPILEELCGPPPQGATWDLDRPFRLSPMQGVSTCMMVALGWARRMGCWKKDYTPGEGTSRFEAQCRRQSAWITPQSMQCGPPAPGAIAVIGSGYRTHALMVVRCDVEQAKIWTVDGGQVGKAGLQAVFGRVRGYYHRGSLPYIGSRQVLGWSDPGLVLYNESRNFMRAPLGWSLLQKWIDRAVS